MKYHLVDLPRIGTDEIGYLSFFESGDAIPFDVKRIYYIYNTPVDMVRGHHAHKRLRQAMWAPAGPVDLTLDDGHTEVTVTLERPDQLLVLEPGMWRGFQFHRPDSTLCVAASDRYEAEDYVRDYDEFKRLVESGFWA